MEIYNTGFHVSVNEIEDYGNPRHGGEYKFQQVTVCTEIIINQQNFLAYYSSGVSLILHKKHHRWNPALELDDYEDTFTDKMLLYIDGITPKMIQDETQEHLDFVSAFSRDIRTAADLLKVHQFLKDNVPDINDFKDLKPD